MLSVRHESYVIDQGVGRSANCDLDGWIPRIIQRPRSNSVFIDLERVSSVSNDQAYWLDSLRKLYKCNLV